MKRIITTLLIASIFTACSKDKTEPTNNNNNGGGTTTKTPKELLVGTWKIESSMMNGSNTLPDCSKDNLVIYKADGTYTSDQGAVKCDPTDAQTQDGTWNLDSNPAFKYKLNTSTDFTNATIKTLNETTLSIEVPYDGEPTPMTLTFKRQ